jgi:hypothetical protein
MEPFGILDCSTFEECLELRQAAGFNPPLTTPDC